ncbi:MAG TPA: RDD family protein [Candidatus Dormibacteraeota bacterium]|nr:RDD family protein [Candidatus Dormibacteraeota bacterium]
MRCDQCGAWAEEGSASCPSCGAPLTAESSEAAASADGLVRTAYAGFWLRLTAYAIDVLILSAATLIIMVPLAPLFFGTKPPQPPMPGESLRPAAMLFVWTVWGLSIIGSWLYFALFEISSWQATPGKRVLGLFVTDMQGRTISFARATARFFGKILSSATLLIGYFMIGFTAKKQGLHDMLADCLVLRRI